MLRTTDMEDTEEEMSDSLAIKQQNDRPKSSGDKMRSKQKSYCHQRGGNYDAKSEKDSSEPKRKVADSKSKVNGYKFIVFEIFLTSLVFQEKEIIVAEDVDRKEECKNLLGTLNRSDDSIPFRQPVKLLNVPDYLQVIDQPMDLQTVGEKLQADNYATLSEFAEDVRLIITNSKKFRPSKTSVIYAMTDRLSILFEDHIRHILATYETRKTTTGCNSKLFQLIT